MQADPGDAWGDDVWLEPSAAPGRGRAGRWLLAVLLVVVVIAGAGAGIAGVIGHTSPFAFLAAPDPGAGSGAIAQVDRALVDVTSRLAGGQGVAAGTGMILTPGGEVITNNHVIAGADTITVQVDGAGPALPATVVGDDPVRDVALLQIQGASNMPTVTTSETGRLQIGDGVTALGNALGRGGTPAQVSGSVTALNETITVTDEAGGSETLSDLIETNAQIQPGDSGGPLLDAGGRVVGMTTAAELSGSRRQSQTTAGYAIPIADATHVAQQIRQGGGGASTVEVGYPPIIGVDVGSTGTSGGVPITGVQPGSPADRAGLTDGDVITGVDGVVVTTPMQLRVAIRKHHVGDAVSVSWNDTSAAKHTATLGLIAGPPD